MLTPHQARCLRKFAGCAVGWERDDLVRGGKTLHELVKLGCLEQKWVGGTRWLRLTAKGERAAYSEIRRVDPIDGGGMNTPSLFVGARRRSLTESE
jgi:hypothetical protein